MEQKVKDALWELTMFIEDYLNDNGRQNESLKLNQKIRELIQD